MDEQEFVLLLEALLQPDTQKVKAATSQLNKTYYTSPASLSALLHILTTHESPQLRQLAAIEARKLVGKHWAKLPDAQKTQLREALLKSTIEEDQQLARHSKARVVAAVAKIDLQDGQWSDLPGTLQQAATSPQARHREVGIYIIYTLLEASPDMFQENMTQMLALFTRTIEDPESVEVRINTMLALAELGLVLDTDEDQKSLKAFQATIPKMVKVLQQAVTDNDEEHAMQAFDVFNRLLSYETAFLNAHFGDLLQFFMQIAANKDADDDMRSQALAFLMQAVRYRKLKVQSLKVGEPMTKMCLQIATELGDLDADDDDVSPARSALGLLDILSESLPPSQVAVPLLSAIGPYVQSQDPSHRRAGILALGMCVEGAPDFIATQLKEILPLVLHLLEDSSVSVRSAALNGVARLADDLAEDMAKQHTRLLPALVKNFDLALQGSHNASAGSREHNENINIIKASCIAIDSLVEGLDSEDAARYVDELVPRFAGLFEHEDYKVRMAAVSALGSTAAAAESAFQPYFDRAMQSLGPYINIKEDEEELELRSMVVDCLAKIAGAVGAEAFQRFVRPLMQSSEEALQLDHSRLKETSFILWGTLARVYEEKFEPFLAGVVKALMESMEQDEIDSEVQLGAEASDLIGKEVTVAGKKIKVAGVHGVDEDDEDDDDDAAIETLMAGLEDGEDDDWDDLEAVTAVAMEKEIAVEIMGDVLTHTKSKFLPYLEKTIAITIPLLDHTYEGVRKSAVSTLWRAYACLFGIEEDRGMAKWQPGLPVKVQPSGDLKKLGDLIMKGTLALFEEEMDRATVTEVNRNVAATLKLCGPAILGDENTTSGAKPIEQLTAGTLLILQKQHPCQKDEDDLDGEVMDDETAEYDWLVIETALEVVAALSAALGEQSAELWKIFESPIMKFASSQEHFERSSAVGTTADCVESMKNSCTPYTKRILTMLLKRLRDENPEVKSNAAFGTGLLCLYSQDNSQIVPAYSTILGLLEPMLDKNDSDSDESSARLLDNAAGCVSRMIKAHPDKVPLEQALPALVNILPLKHDFRENEPVYDLIVSLYQANEPNIQQLTTKLKPVLQTVLGEPDDQLSSDLKEKVQQLAQFLSTK